MGSITKLVESNLLLGAYLLEAMSMAGPDHVVDVHGVIDLPPGGQVQRGPGECGPPDQVQDLRPLGLSPPPPGWSPRVPLEDGLRRFWAGTP